jgi:hypothetical protein
MMSSAISTGRAGSMTTAMSPSGRSASRVPRSTIHRPSRVRARARAAVASGPGGHGQHGQGDRLPDRHVVVG